MTLIVHKLLPALSASCSEPGYLLRGFWSFIYLVPVKWFHRRECHSPLLADWDHVGKWQSREDFCLESTMYDFLHWVGFRFLKWIVLILPKKIGSAVFLLLSSYPFSGAGGQRLFPSLSHTVHTWIAWHLSQDAAFFSSDSCFSLFLSPIRGHQTTLLWDFSQVLQRISSCFYCYGRRNMRPINIHTQIRDIF